MSAKEVKHTFPKKNVRFIRWKSAQRSINPFKDFLALNELYKILKRLKKKNLVDAVHLHSSKSGLLGRMACRMAGVEKVIYTPNGAPFLSGSNAFSNYIYQQLEKFGSRIGGDIVCCSASELSEYSRIGIKASYINNGISIPAPAPMGDLPKGKSNNKFVVITSGRVVDQKNPQLFNEIASYFQEFDQFEFVWAGDGQNRSVLSSKNITITGWLNSEATKRLVYTADLYISTSVYEGLSFGVLEALALQKPVLLSDCVGNKDVIRGGINGDIFKNKTEAIIKILSYFNNWEMMSIMGQHSSAICTSEFNMHQNFPAYKQAYVGLPSITKSIAL